MIRLIKLLWIAWVTSICCLFTWAVVSPHVPKARLFTVMEVSDASLGWEEIKSLALAYGSRTENKQIIRYWKSGDLYLAVCYDEEYKAIQFTEAKANDIFIVTYWENLEKCKVTHVSNGVKREVSIPPEDSKELVNWFLNDLKPLLRGVGVKT